MTDFFPSLVEYHRLSGQFVISTIPPFTESIVSGVETYQKHYQHQKQTLRQTIQLNRVTAFSPLISFAQMGQSLFSRIAIRTVPNQRLIITRVILNTEMPIAQHPRQ